MATNDGAFGAGRLMCPSSTPLDVLTKRMSPDAVTEQLHMLCCEMPNLLHHVELPDDVGFVLAGVLFILVGAVVLVVVKALGVEADDLAAAGDEPQPVPFDAGRAADAHQRPIVHAAGGQLLARVLPEELAVGFVEAQEHAQVDRGRIALQIAGAVVGADVDLAVGDDRVAVGLRAEPGDPLDVLAISPCATRRSWGRNRPRSTRRECFFRWAYCCASAIRPTAASPAARRLAAALKAAWS